MSLTINDPGDLARLATSPLRGDLLDAPAVVVDLRGDVAGIDLRALRDLPRVVVGLGPGHPDVDVVADDETGADEVVAAVERHRRAAMTLAWLLRSTVGASPQQGLMAESAAYSTLQAGPDHARWLAARQPRSPRAGDEGRVRVERSDGVVRITLTRPATRNAVDAAMQQALIDAVAVIDPGERVEIGGDGPCFSSGGDLWEFGTRADPATAHLLRLERSAGRALLSVAPRCTAFVHGPCHGGGVELAAFAGRVVAHRDTTFTLPEIGLGLIPGAGGTVSIVGRIGRHRFAWLALTASTIDADTAADWGLVDEVVERFDQARGTDD